MSITPDTIYCGHREDVIAEYGGMAHIYPGKYLIQPDGNGSFDAEGASSKADMELFIKEFQALYPGIRVVRL